MVNVAADGAFIEFAAVADWVSAAESNSHAVLLLSQYFTQLRDDHLLHAVRYFAGQAVPLRERPITPIGEVTLISALSVLTGAEPASLSEQYQQLGDWSEVAAQVLVKRTDPVLTLEDVAIALEQLAKAKSKRRLGWVIRLLARATPPEARCLTQLMLGRLQIERAEQTVELAVAQMVDQPLERIQWGHVLLGDLGKTAVVARHGQLEQARMQLFQPLKFMLASTASEPLQLLESWSGGYAVEPKYDGLRVQAHIAPADRSSDLQEETVVAGIRVALFSRSLAEITTSFLDLIVPLAALEPRALVSGESAGLVLDGEIVPYRVLADRRQILPFSALQPRLDASAAAADTAAVSVAFVAYDLLYKDGEILLNQPYSQRRAALEGLAMETAKVWLAEARTFEHLADLTAYLRTRPLGAAGEGFMVKSLRARYRPGRHSRDWLKLKQVEVTIDVVVTAVEQAVAGSDAELEAKPVEAEPSSSGELDSGSSGQTPSVRSSFSIAVRASPSDPTLLSIGKVSADDLEPNQLTLLLDWFDQHTLEEFAEGRVCLVEPQIVLEVAFSRLQPSSRYKSGYLLEQPRIIRVRSDKPVSEIESLESLAELAAPERPQPLQNSS